MKTKSSIKQKLILAVFTVCILAVKIGAFYYVLKTIDSKAGMEAYIIGAFYYTLMLLLMAYLGYIGKGLKAMSIIFAVELVLVLGAVLFAQLNSLVPYESIFNEIANLIYVVLLVFYISVLGSHCSLFTAFDLEFWQFYLMLILIYAVFIAVGIVSNRLNKRKKD